MRILKWIWEFLHPIPSFDVLVVSQEELQDALEKQLGVRGEFWDGKFYYVREDDWRRLIRRDLTNEVKWIAERRDCDNIAAIFKCHMSEKYLLNGVGVVVGEVKDAKTGEFAGCHAWNVLASEKGLLFYDAKVDGVAYAKQGAVIGYWEYYADEVRWY